MVSLKLTKLAIDKLTKIKSFKAKRSAESKVHRFSFAGDRKEESECVNKKPQSMLSVSLFLSLSLSLARSLARSLPLSFSLSLSLSLSLSPLSLSLPISLSFYLFVSLSVCLSLSLTLCLSVSLSLTLCLSLSPFLHPSLRLYFSRKWSGSFVSWFRLSKAKLKNMHPTGHCQLAYST